MSLLLDAIKQTIPEEALELKPSRLAACSNVTLLQTMRMGMCSTLNDDRVFEFHVRRPVNNLGKIQEMRLGEILDWTDSLQGIERSFALAGINSALPLKGKKFFEGNALDITAWLGTDKKVATIGHFPNTQHISSKAKSFTVIEKRPQEGDRKASEAVSILPETDVVTITGVTCLNDTLEGLCALKKPGSIYILLGPSVPLSPVLFDFGVDIIGGSWIENPDTAYVKALQGASPRNMKDCVKSVLFAKDPELLEKLNLPEALFRE